MNESFNRRRWMTSSESIDQKKNNVALEHVSSVAPFKLSSWTAYILLCIDILGPCQWYVAYIDIVYRRIYILATAHRLVWMNFKIGYIFYRVWKKFVDFTDFVFSVHTLLSFQKVCRIRQFFFSVCCPSVMSLKPLFEWSQLQLSCKYTTVGI